jgi:hypothetical protein
MNAFLSENWYWLLATGYELIVRVIPTSRSWSLFIAASKLMQLIPDRAKKEHGAQFEGERVHVVKVEKRTI